MRLWGIWDESLLRPGDEVLILLSMGSFQAQRRVVSTIAERSVRPPTVPTYTAEQQRLGRPLSPYVTIYKQPLPAISSITNRVTGVALSLGLATGSAIAAVGGDVPSSIQSVVQATPHATPIVKFVVALPLTYHWMNAARHQFWNWKPEYINLKVASSTSAVIFGVALVLSGAASVVTLRPTTKMEDVVK